MSHINSPDVSTVQVWMCKEAAEGANAARDGYMVQARLQETGFSSEVEV